MKVNNIDVVDNLKMISIYDIKPYFRNPRKNDKTVELLVKYIPQVGFNVPLVLDKDNVIVKGHSRYYAGFKLGMDKLPVVYTEADEEQIRLDRIADNKIQEFSEWLPEQLGHELSMLDFDDIKELEFELDFNNMNVDFDSFDMTSDNQDNESQEDKEKRYQEYLESQGVNQSHINKAEEKQQEIGTKKQKYYKFVCPKCSNIHFVRAEDVWEIDESEL